MHKIVKKWLNEAWTNVFLVETLQEKGFQTLRSMISTYPSTIKDKSSASYTRALAQYSMSELGSFKTPHNQKKPTTTNKTVKTNK